MSFTYSQPPANLGNSLVIDSPDATGPTIAKRVINILGNAGGSSINENVDNILGYTKTTAAAGTAQVLTLQFSGATFVAGSLYKVALRRNDTGQVITTSIVAATPSASDFATTVAQEWNNMVGGIVTAAVVSSTKVSFTQAVDTGGFTAAQYPTGTTITTPTTAYVASSGSQAEVQQYNAAAAITSYDKYTFQRKVLQRGIGIETVVQDIVWVGSGQTNTAAWETVLDNLLSGASGSTATLLQPYVAPVATPS